MKKLTNETILKIIDFYTKGMSPKEIGETFGIRNNSVTRILKKYGVDRTQLQIVSDINIKYIIDQYLLGVSSTIIAATLKLSNSTVSRILKRNNVEIKSRLFRSQPKSQAILVNDEKYNTTFIPTYNNIQLTSKNVKMLSDEDKHKAAIFATDFYRKGGFPYPIITNNELIRSFDLLKKVDSNSIEKDNILRIENLNGMSIYRHFSPHFYEVKSGKGKTRPSMLEAFNDDAKLLKVIKNRFSYNYHINGNMLRQGIANSKVAFKASVFNVIIAKYIYNKFCKENDIIYDYSMGFGQRLTAALSLPFKVKYVGVDTWSKSVDSNRNIFDFFNKNTALNKDADFHCIGSEDFCDPLLIGKVNIAFSSPPYFNLESYCDEETQAYSNNDYKYFINTWWSKTINNIDKLLAPDGILVLNINETMNGLNIGSDMCDIIKNNGFQLVDTYKIRLSRNLQFKNRKDFKYEPIFIFRRNIIA